MSALGSHRAIQTMVWLLVGALVVIALSLLWSAGEAHYRGCIEAVQIRNANDDSQLARLARTEGLERCGRLPF